MGISNFTKLIESFDEEGEQWNVSYDSILVDLQSELYVAIDQCFPLNDVYDRRCEKRFFIDVSLVVEKRLAEILLDLFRNHPRRSDDEITVVCSLDGRGVPMKWPTQRNRRVRNRKEPLQGKNLYRVSLFGKNLLSSIVCHNLVHSLISGKFHDNYFRAVRPAILPKYIRYVLSGCDVEGEGEHKIFHVAETLGLRYPLFVSVDNDAFVLGFARIERYECVQLRNKRNKVYNLTHFVRDVLKFPVDVLIFASFLFGNDFIPPVVAVTDNNCCNVRQNLTSAWEEMLEFDEARDGATDPEEKLRWMSPLYVRFLSGMQSCMRYEKDPARSPSELETVAVRFWITCFWTLDYYRNRQFVQKLAKNEIFDAFDRNGLLAVLTHRGRSMETFHKALKGYKDNMIPRENRMADDVAAKRVFDSESLPIITKFLILDEDENGDGSDELGDGYCHDIKLSTRKRKVAQSNEI